MVSDLEKVVFDAVALFVKTPVNNPLVFVPAAALRLFLLQRYKICMNTRLRLYHDINKKNTLCKVYIFNFEVA